MRYAKPKHPELRLEVAPVLASWNRSDHADQIKLRDFLDHVETLLAKTPPDASDAALRVSALGWQKLSP